MKLSKDNFIKARDFILTNVRMIERRLYHYHFENDTNQGIYHAVLAYRNVDGGFGYGMEPDTASPESQPLFSIMALEYLDEAHLLNAEVLEKDYMAYFLDITTEKGGIPWMFRPKSDYPCEEHFKTIKEWAALSTTSALLGLLEKYKVDIPWMIKAEEFVWSESERIKDKHIFCHLCTPRRLMFLENTRSKEKAKASIENLKTWILKEGVICDDYSDEGWGLYGKPHRLYYAPKPNSLLHSIFKQEDLDRDLDELIKHQKNDGRWDTWYGISEGTKLEWAGIQTLWTLKVLRNYNRIEF